MEGGADLPREVAELQRMLADTQARLAEANKRLDEKDRIIALRDAELYAKTLQIEHLKARLARLRRQQFGRSSEKLDREIEQLELMLGELEEGVAESKTQAERANNGPATARRKRKHTPHGRKPLPEHLPRERVTLEPAPSCHCCGGTGLRKIDDVVTEVLEYVPSSFKSLPPRRRGWSSTCGRR